MDGVGINDNGLGSAGDLPALAVKEETIAPFRRSMGGDGGLVGKSAVTAAVAAVQQNLARMEKVRVAHARSFLATDILPRPAYPAMIQSRKGKRAEFFFHATLRNRDRARLEV